MYSVIKKKFSNLSPNDMEKLGETSSPTGAFKVLLANFQKGKIQKADDISISILMDASENVLGWLLLDQAKEYNQFLKDDQVSIMIYVSPSKRGCGLASKLIDFEKGDLFGKTLFAYPDQETKRFFRKLGSAHNLKFRFQEPIFYWYR